MLSRSSSCLVSISDIFFFYESMNLYLWIDERIRCLLACHVALLPILSLLPILPGSSVGLSFESPGPFSPFGVVSSLAMMLFGGGGLGSLAITDRRRRVSRTSLVRVDLWHDDTYVCTYLA